MMLFCVGKTSGTNPSEMQGLEALIMTHAIQGRSSGSQLIKKKSSMDFVTCLIKDGDCIYWSPLLR